MNSENQKNWGLAAEQDAHLFRGGRAGPIRRFFGRGIGDLVANLLRWIGVSSAVAWLQRRRLMRPCSCAARRARLNAWLPW